jgi:hypothetical protein
MNGGRWSIGDGTSIKVMNDPWLRDIAGAWIPSPQVQGVQNLKVNDLMTPNVKMWDKGKIEYLFPMHIANRILDIPLYDLLVEDKIVWIDSTNGHYNVKSGYKLWLNVSGKGRLAAQDEDWSSLWKILAPPKTKHLLWRISKGCFPTRKCLQENHVPCSSVCPLCNNEDESDWHVLFNCTATVHAWQTVGLGELMMRSLQHEADTRFVIHHLCSGENSEVAGLFAMTVWVLWNNRNNKVWNDTAEPGRNLGFKAKQLWDEWFLVQHMQYSRQQFVQQQQHDVTWQKPSQGWYKCNVDAGFHKELSTTRMGWRVRDHLGQFRRAETTWRHGSCSIMEGESIALLEALHAMEQQWHYSCYF